jgi:hypothetical protein
MSESHPELQTAARELISGKRRGLLVVLPFLDPTAIASVASVGPGKLSSSCPQPGATIQVSGKAHVIGRRIASNISVRRS